MSNTKHTPGPWFITEGPTYGHTSRLKVESAPDAEREFGMVIMERSVQSGLPSALDQECMANAKLIAAAPELLEALEETSAALLQYFSGVGSKVDAKARYELARAAIAKSQG